MERRRGFEEKIKPEGIRRLRMLEEGEEVEGRQRGRGDDREKEGSRWWRN